MNVGIIGAGPAGLTAAYELAKQNIQVEVFEASPHIGGLARSIELWGHRVDLGPHRFFSEDRRVNALWLEIAQRNYAMVERRTRILYNKKMFAYPLSAPDALLKLGPVEAAACVWSYLRTAGERGPDTPRDFESWVVSRFGRRLFEIFFKSYSEKLWGISCRDLDADFAAQRIRKFSLLEAVKSMALVSKTEHRTLADRFAYPLAGTGSIYEKMADEIRRRGGAVHLSTPVRRVRENSTMASIELQDGDVRMFTKVVSTMPLTHLVKGFDDIPAPVKSAADSLRFRSTILVYLRVDHTDVFSDNWIYIHAPDIAIGRVTNFRNWVPQLYGSSQYTVLAAEYWCDAEDTTWGRPDADLIAQAGRELEECGLISRQWIRDGHVLRLRNSYPVYARGYHEHVSTIISYLKTRKNITAIGRYGSFKYNNQDHSILMGILAAENIAQNKDHDLWAVNAGDDYHERARISEVGLELE